MLSTKLKEAAGNSADATLYVDDVFSTYLWDNVDGTSNPVVNGIDLSTNGGFVWMKKRTSSFDNHILYDTARGTTSALSSNTTDSQTAGYGNITYNTTGFTKGAGGGTGSFVSWTFRKAAKFFDVVTYTGNGTDNRNIAHSLGCPAGMIFIKSTNQGGSNNYNWAVAHRKDGGLGVNGLSLNTVGAYSYDDFPVTSSTFNVSATQNTTTSVTNTYGYGQNQSGVTYVAYLFAHDTSSTGIIQCGSFTASGSGAYSGSATVNLGWEPQYVLMKEASNTLGRVDWTIVDMMRGWPAPDTNNTFGYANVLSANNANAAVNAGDCGWPTATGFSVGQVTGGATYIYMAIRRPNKPPTSGTQVFSPIVNTGSSYTYITTNFPVDLSIWNYKPGYSLNSVVNDRLRGVSSNSTPSGNNLSTSLTAAEVSTQPTVGWDNTGLVSTSNSTINWNFKRAPGFFDEVCWTGDNGSNQRVSHNLTVVPELIIYKGRNKVNYWRVYYGNINQYIALNLNSAVVTGSNLWGSSAPTTTDFGINCGSMDLDNFNAVAYLFATLAGISKVGSYTGNGTGQAIACGFSAGARFVLIKRTDSTGGWYTFDSARGLTSGSSPYLLLNSTAAEVTGNNGVYQSTGGFTLGATAVTTTNILGASYIYLSVA